MYLNIKKSLNQHFKTISILSAFIVYSLSCLAQDFPAKANKLVNDYTGTLSVEETQLLETKLVAFADTTSTQIAVVVVNSLNGYEVSEYALKLAENWQIGQQGKNNGILLLASLGDRKITIQTGYGLEAVLPDALCKRIIEREIKPYFKQQRYFEGLDAATNAIISATKGEYKADKKPIKNNNALLIIFGAMILIAILGRIMKNKNNGNVIDGGGSSNLFWLAMLLGSGRNQGNGWKDFSGGSGNFGGFGGGSFGGGGASGDW